MFEASVSRQDVCPCVAVVLHTLLYRCEHYKTPKRHDMRRRFACEVAVSNYMFVFVLDAGRFWRICMHAYVRLQCVYVCSMFD